MKVVSHFQFQTGATCSLEVEVPEEEVRNAWDSVLQKILPAAVIPGFRPGKVPRAIVERRYEGSIKEEVEKRLIEESLSSAFQSHHLDVARCTLVDVGEVRCGQPFRYSAALEVWPKIEKLVWRELAVTRIRYTVPESQVDTVLERLRRSHAVLEPRAADQSIEADDVVEIEYSIRSEGEAASQGERAQVDLSEKTGLSERLSGRLVGHKQGDSVEWLEDSDTATRPTRHRATIVKVFRKQLPDLDDEFARSVSAAESISELRKLIREDLELSAKHRADSDLRRAAIDALVAANEPVSVPPSVVREQALREAARQLAAAGIPPEVAARYLREKGEELIEQLIPVVERDLKAMRLLDRLAVEEGVTVSEAEIDAVVNQQGGGERNAEQAAVARSEAYRSKVKEAIERRKAVDALIREAAIVEDQHDFIIADA